DGRDIGTVIAPGADVKLFVIASPEVRAKRRVLELRARGEEADEEEVLADLLRRDERDSRRTAAPLKLAPDAHLLDTTHLDIDAAFRAAIEIIEAVRTGRCPRLRQWRNARSGSECVARLEFCPDRLALAPPAGSTGGCHAFRVI